MDQRVVELRVLLDSAPDWPCDLLPGCARVFLRVHRFGLDSAPDCPCDLSVGFARVLAHRFVWNRLPIASADEVHAAPDCSCGIFAGLWIRLPMGHVVFKLDLLQDLCI